MKQFLFEYLVSPEDKRTAMLAEMIRRPDEASDALLTFRGPYPDHTNPVDVFPDYLSPLLTELLKTCPHLLIGHDLTRMEPGKRWALIEAVMSRGSSQFAEVVLAALKDRSMDVRAIAIKALVQCPFLRTPEARPQLQSLLTLKSMAYCRDETRRALDALDDRTGA